MAQCSSSSDAAPETPIAPTRAPAASRHSTPPGKGASALLAAAPAVPMARSCGILGPMPEAKRGAGDCTIPSSQLALDGVGVTQSHNSAIRAAVWAHRHLGRSALVVLVLVSQLAARAVHADAHRRLGVRKVRREPTRRRHGLQHEHAAAGVENAHADRVKAESCRLAECHAAHLICRLESEHWPAGREPRVARSLRCMIDGWACRLCRLCRHLRLPRRRVLGEPGGPSRRLSRCHRHASTEAWARQDECEHLERLFLEVADILWPRWVEL
mmetsp:Transcript_18807/g.60096  ORF Transcript_18807/g.60096 Transcript_18807/m.60096 type:complete len:271 (+) Transcript_18807:185-997(+)